MTHMSVTATDVATVLGGRRVLGRSIRNGRDLEELIREGVPKPALERLDRAGLHGLPA